MVIQLDFYDNFYMHLIHLSHLQNSSGGNFNFYHEKRSNQAFDDIGEDHQIAV